MQERKERDIHHEVHMLVVQGIVLQHERKNFYWKVPTLLYRSNLINGIKIILEFMLAFGFSTDRIHFRSIINGLKKKISPGEKFLFMIVQEPI